MKKKKPTLALYKKLLETGRLNTTLGGLCVELRSLDFEELFSPFCAKLNDKTDLSFLRAHEDACNKTMSRMVRVFWAYEDPLKIRSVMSASDELVVRKAFTPLRQTILLLYAAYLGEL